MPKNRCHVECVHGVLESSLGSRELDGARLLPEGPEVLACADEQFFPDDGWGAADLFAELVDRQDVQVIARTEHGDPPGLIDEIDPFVGRYGRGDVLAARAERSRSRTRLPDLGSNLVISPVADHVDAPR